MFVSSLIGMHLPAERKGTVLSAKNRLSALLVGGARRQNPIGDLEHSQQGTMPHLGEREEKTAARRSREQMAGEGHVLAMRSPANTLFEWDYC